MKQDIQSTIWRNTLWLIRNTSSAQHEMFFASNFTIPDVAEEVQLAVSTQIEDFLIQYEENPQNA